MENKNYTQANVYLEKLALNVLKDINKMYKPYSRKKFITEYELKQIYFTFEDMERENIEGYYLDCRMNTDVKYRHKIAVSSEFLEDNILNPTNKCSKEQKRLNKKIKEVLIHELCHYWVKSWIDEDISFYNLDSSPLFVALVLWINPFEKNAYESFKDACYSEFYYSVMETETLDEVEVHLISTAIKLNKIRRKYPNIKFEWEDKYENCCVNYFERSSYLTHKAIFLSPYRYKVNTSEQTVEALKSVVSEDFKTIAIQDIIDKEGLTLEEAKVEYERTTKELNKIIEDFETGKNATYQHKIVLSREINDLDDLERQIDFLAKEIQEDLNEEYKFLNKNNIKGGMSNEI